MAVCLRVSQGELRHADVWHVPLEPQLYLLLELTPVL